MRRSCVYLVYVLVLIGQSAWSDNEGSLPRVPPDKRGSLDCHQVGSAFQPFDLSQNRFIGKFGFGFRYENQCENAVYVARKVNSVAVCNWNGRNFQPYGVLNNNAVGKRDFGFFDSDMCNYSVERSANGLLCNTSGGGWTPYEIESSLPVAKANGDQHYGFLEIEDCFQEIRLVNENSLCSWNGRNWQPYYIGAKRLIGIQDFGFRQIEDCRMSVRLARNGLVCNWNGNGLQLYRVEDNAPVGPTTHSTVFNCYSEADSYLRK